MNHILVINGSVSGTAAVSRLLVGDIVQRLVDINPQAYLTYRDAGQDPIPHLTPATVAELATRTLSDQLAGAPAQGEAA